MAVKRVHPKAGKTMAKYIEYKLPPEESQSEPEGVAGTLAYVVMADPHRPKDVQVVQQSQHPGDNTFILDVAGTLFVVTIDYKE